MTQFSDFLTIHKLGDTRGHDILESGESIVYDKNGIRTAFLQHEGAKFVGYIELAPNKPRGNHYHYKKEEMFVVIHGELEGKFAHPDAPDDIETHMFQPGDCVFVKPPLAHTYVSKNGVAVAVELTATPYHRDDTVKFSFEK